MRPLVKAAMQSSNATARSTRKSEIDVKTKKQRRNVTNVKAIVDEDDGATTKNTRKLSLPAVDQHASSRKEFMEHSSSAPRRLNDVAQAPPEFKNLPGRAAALQGSVRNGKREGVLSMAQKSMMEQEREKVILRYRELKAQRTQPLGETGMA